MVYTGKAIPFLAKKLLGRAGVWLAQNTLKAKLVRAGVSESIYLGFSYVTGEKITTGGVLGAGLGGAFPGWKRAAGFALGSQFVDLKIHNKELRISEYITDVALAAVFDKAFSKASLRYFKNARLPKYKALIQKPFVAFPRLRPAYLSFKPVVNRMMRPSSVFPQGAATSLFIGLESEILDYLIEDERFRQVNQLWDNE
jgi:hypothetical protein